MTLPELFDAFAEWVNRPNPTLDRIRENKSVEVSGGTYLQEPLIYEEPPMKRRNFFALLFTPLLARFAPKPTTFGNALRNGPVGPAIPIKQTITTSGSTTISGLTE